MTTDHYIDSCIRAFFFSLATNASNGHEFYHPHIANNRLLSPNNVSTCLRAVALQHAEACLRAIAGTSACEGMLTYYRSWFRDGIKSEIENLYTGDSQAVYSFEIY
jgi:hypothetical protein